MRRDALPLEKLGEWDGVPKMRVLPNAVDWAGHSAERFEKRVEWNESRIMWWLNEGGAKPTTKVVWMLEKVGPCCSLWRPVSLSLLSRTSGSGRKARLTRSSVGCSRALC